MNNLSILHPRGLSKILLFRFFFLVCFSFNNLFQKIAEKNLIVRFERVTNLSVIILINSEYISTNQYQNPKSLICV